MSFLHPQELIFCLPQRTCLGMCTDPNGEAYMISKAYAESCFPTFSLKPPYGNWIHVEDSFMVSLRQLADTVGETSDHTHAPRNGQDE